VNSDAGPFGRIEDPHVETVRLAELGEVTRLDQMDMGRRPGRAEGTRGTRGRPSSQCRGAQSSRPLGGGGERLMTVVREVVERNGERRVR